LVKSFIESDFQYGAFTYTDKYLNSGKTYVYSVEAVDCSGNVISSSGFGSLIEDNDSNINTRKKINLSRGENEKR
jgi:hypothetical protein